MLLSFSRRDRRLALLAALTAFAVYNANLRVIATGDSFPARFLPFALWAHGTVYLDPVLAATMQHQSNPYWVQTTRNGHQASLFPVVTPVLIAPLYLPAVLYLQATGWKQGDLDRVAIIMEKLSASLVTSLAGGLMFLALRRRAGTQDALLLTAAFAFATGTWSTSSQALWLHAVAELMAAAALWLMTGEPTRARAFLAGFAVATLAVNRTPDVFIAAAFAIYSPFWAGRRTPLFALGGAGPALLVLAYNLVSFHHPAGAWGVAIGGAFFTHSILPGLAGLLVSPGRGLFVFYPFLLFLPLFFLRAVREPETRRLTLFLAGGVLLHILFYARTDWRAGFSYGPRYLLDLVPVLVWMLAPVVASLGRPARAVFVTLVLFSVGVEFIGVFFYTGASNLLYFRQEYPSDVRALWRPENAQFLLEARQPPPPEELFHAFQDRLLPPAPAGLPRVGPLSDFYTVLPCRLVDTREGEPLMTAEPPRSFRIAGGGCAVPPAAVAVAATVTVAGGGDGAVLLRAGVDQGWLELEFHGMAPRSFPVLLPLSPQGTVTASLAGRGRAHLIVDVSGYFAP
jgi:hypothetical protein